MKRLLFLSAAFSFLLLSIDTSAQVLSESAKRKVTVGVDLFTDIWIYEQEEPYVPAGFSTRTINQGVNAFVMYNLALGESLNSFSIGLAISAHNLYSNSRIADIKADTIRWEVIPDDIDYRKVKINPVYIELPVELKLRTDKGFKVGLGLKVGYLIDSKEKYKGNRPSDKYNVMVKTKDIRQMESWVFGGTFRIGYKWISFFGYYPFTKLFVQGRGPDIYPVSLGITITPF
jgi:hypothetical protein